MGLQLDWKQKMLGSITQGLGEALLVPRKPIAAQVYMTREEQPPQMGKWLCKKCRYRRSMGGSSPYPTLMKAKEKVFVGEWLRKEGCSTSLQKPLTLLLSPGVRCESII